MSNADSPGAGRRGMTWPQMLAMAIGVVYTLVGIVGFFITGFDDFAEHTDETIIGFSINPLHNIVHLVIGLAGIALARKLSTARTYGWLLAVGYGAAFIYGLFAAGEEEPLNFLSINWADNWLHLASVIAGLAIALGPVKTVDSTHGSDQSLRR
ncbi:MULTISPECIES: DUF4383 domain-containing protein [unclassified Modestobacter]|uniref:DUF4383 domain-containing protein n=1 Tax=unclassified Modestobacter TaxID=2643866 RepID=UPI0022AA5AFD|nr:MULTISPECIES: DUF4383 domain-containing protein [unclassified Modestobacter]MCZ2823147.1 DUF4383 domain-containing protein [Modestobacter sp. VKM Ac-2981]MCZ2851393.1 DUF4383 domain-containing protein [Modestobacter sp. VKM Ac-2982]